MVLSVALRDALALRQLATDALSNGIVRWAESTSSSETVSDGFPPPEFFNIVVGCSTLELSC